MSPREDRAEELFSSALEIGTSAQRRTFVQQACAGDEVLRQRVEELLSAHDEAVGFLEKPAPEVPVALSAVAQVTSGQSLVSGPAEKPGDQIGAYRLVDHIGEGGFGHVWMAEQESPFRRRVALKIIKLGMETRETLARFEAERQAMALMNHPHIAKALDAGATTAGRPFFVMELVEGQSITQYADQNQVNLTTRLQLFVQVCLAVQHAHQKGVVHRDLKPSNVLVAELDGRPVPKVIDFGLVKAMEGRLTEKTLFTQIHHLMGTPCYMSPEQAGLDNLDIDTRSDIYSLGILLYELLTGNTPFDAGELARIGVDEMRRTIRERKPTRPSTHLRALPLPTLQAVARQRQTDPWRLRTLLRGDLDWIVMKCLEKDRDRRYATANGLAADIRRHLNHEPVMARPPGKLYRFRKMVRRNLLAFTLVNTVAAGLAIGLVITFTLLRREREAHQLAHAAERNAAASLRQSYLAQARASRYSGRSGQRFDSLEALGKAAAIQSDLVLRNEAIAGLALPDVRVVKEWRLPFATPAKTFDYDLRQCACVDTNGTVVVRRLEDQRDLWRLPGPRAKAWVPEFSPDGRFLAIEFLLPTGARTVQVWSLESGRTVLEVPRGRWFAFRPDSEEIAISTEANGVVMHPLHNGQGVKNLLEAGWPHVRYSPDGKHLAAASESQPDVRVYDPASLTLIRTLAAPKSVYALAWHPNGKRLAAGAGDGRIYAWDITSGKEQARLEGHQSAVTRLAFNHAGNLLASSGWDSDIRLWDPERGALLLKFANGRIYHFSPDDRFLGIDQGEANLKLAEVADGRECRLLRLRSESGPSAWTASFHPGSRVLASAEVEGVGLWDALGGERVAFLEIGNTPSALFHPPTGDLFTISPRGLERWPVRFEQTPEAQLARCGPPRSLVQSTNLGRAAISTDGTLLVAAHADDGAELVDLSDPSRPHVTRLSHDRAAYVAVSPDGRWVATGTWQGTGVRIWERQTGRQLMELPVEGTASVTFSPDGQWLVTGTGKEYAFWAVRTWTTHHTIPQAEGNRPPGSLVVGPDVSWAVLSHGVHGLRLVEYPFGKPLGALEAPNAQNIWDLTLSPDGRFLAAPTGDRLIQLWDLARLRRQLAVLNLDWESPRSRALTEAGSVPRLRMEVVTEQPAVP